MINFDTQATLKLGDNNVSFVYLGESLVYSSGLSAGTIFDFDYTGNVQKITLPKGRYKLQCWGAQGGNSAGSSAAIGSKGGYSEGILNLTEKTTLYVFVGGAGLRGSSTSLVNGGWNGGGASVGYSAYNSGDTNGYSYPACGGGATDISTVTSSMSYSSGRTNRSSASLLARFIVAGGGAGGSYRYTETTTTSYEWVTKKATSGRTLNTNSEGIKYRYGTADISSYAGTAGRIHVSGGGHTTSCYYKIFNSSGSVIQSDSSSGSSVDFSITLSSSAATMECGNLGTTSLDPTYNTGQFQIYEPTSSTSTSSSYSNQSQQGGGTSGMGQFPGTQTSAGTGGAFGLGASQSSTNYRYCGGGGGGGWYGGGTSYSDSSTSYVNYSGGGSGFVNIAANASYRPSNYIGLELESGTTMAGNISHPSVDGGTETGHSGNGYARITVLGNEEGTESLLPSGYIMCEYIESTGTQYIDTGIMAKAGLRAIIDCKINDLNSTSNIFGAFDTKNRIYLHYEASIKLLFGYGAYNKVNYNLITGERVVFDAEFNTGTQSLKVNGTQVYSGSSSSSVDTGLAAYLGAMNQGNAASLFTKMTIYSCKIYENEILVRDYIPALRSDGIAGLYDLVDGQFYYSLGSGHFIGKQ